MTTPQKILLVEDSDTQAELLKYILESNGYDVVVAYNGDEGYQLFLQYEPDLVISDILMPIMDGYELCEKIRGGDFLPDVPIILLTELSEPEDVIKGLKFGADNFIKKPYNTKQLLLRIKDILATKQIRHSLAAHEGINFYFNGEKYFVNAEKQQILDLLISTFESAIEQNKELAKTQKQLEKQNHSLSEKTERLKVLEQNYRALIENLPNPVLVLSEKSELLYSNPAAQKLFGESLTQLLPKLSRVIFSNTSKCDLQLRDAADEEITVEVFRSQINWFEQSGWLLSINNVTEHKQVEAALQEAARLKSTFLANISHELRTPLNGIIGMTQLTLDSALHSTQRKNLEIVKQSSESLLSIINDILDYSKLESGMQSFSVSTFNLHELVQQSFDFIKVTAAQKKIVLAHYIDPELPSFVEGDFVKLRQVLINLLGNSVKFTESGEIFLLIEKSGHTDDHIGVQFSVIDSGIGIPKDRQRVIFLPFAQADNSLQRQYGGTGLGLSICNEIISGMGGKIAVESPVSNEYRGEFSSDNPGSRFYFYVPLKAAKSQSDLIPNDIVEEFNNKYSVYIYKCNQVMKRYYLEWFGRYRTNVCLVDSPKDYLEKISKDDHHPVLFLKQLTESELIEWLTFCENSNIKKPVILVSAPVGNYFERVKSPCSLKNLASPVPFTEIYTAVLGKEKDVDSSIAEFLNRSNEIIAPLKILVAEDNAVNQKVAKKILEKLGHQVTLAINGKEAVEVWQAQDFDVILMDVQMPVMDGLEATKEIRRMEAGKKHIPIFALTAHVMESEITRCKQAGMDDHISKPMNFIELEEKLNRIKYEKVKNKEMTTT